MGTAGDRRGEDLVTVERFSTVGAAEVARSVLAAEGIPAVVGERDGLRVDPFKAETRLRIRLQVRSEDVEVAREILGLAGEEG